MLIALLVVELIGLVPWSVFSALSAMGFASGFSWTVFLTMAPFWLYPILILVCAPVAFSLDAKGRTSAATWTILTPVIVSAGWLWLLIMLFP